jgi:hypothetical protein
LIGLPVQKITLAITLLEAISLTILAITLLEAISLTI